MESLAGGVRDEDFGFRVQSSWFAVYGLGFRASGLWSGVQVLGFMGLMSKVWFRG